MSLQQAASGQPSSRRITNFATLDGLRGVAAVAVAVGHGRFLAVGKPTELFSGCYLAVDFFFVLSGFILAHAYGERLRADMSAGRFMVLRLIRLYPLYLLALLLSLGLVAVQVFSNSAAPQPTSTEVIFGFLMLPDPYPRALSFPLNAPDLLFPMNIPAWSLFFELVANLIFAATWKRLSTAVLVPLVVAAGIGLILAVNFRWLGFGALPERFSAGAIWVSAWGGLARVMFSFFAGVLVFRLWRRFPPRRGVPPLIFIGGLFVILAYSPPPDLEIAYALLAALFVFPALVFFGASSVPAKPNARLFTWMGNISYGVYVLQQAYYVLVMALVVACTGREFTGLSTFELLAMFVLLAPLATLTHRYFDVPVRRRLLDLLSTGRVFKMVRARTRFG